MKKRNINGVRIHLIVPVQQRTALEKYARKTGLTVSEHLRRALDAYLNTVEKRA